MAHLLQIALPLALAAWVWLEGRLPTPPTQAALAGLATPLTIFLLRATDQTLATLRVLSVLRGQRAGAWLLGFAQSSVFILAIRGVLENVNQPVNLVAFAAGYASGVVLGMTIEGWLAPGHSVIRVISPRRGGAVAESLRRRGYGVTVLPGKGLQGAVDVILCTIPRRRVQDVRREVLANDPEAFVTVEHVRALRGGYRA